jgi:hypothetical protein
MGMIMMSMGMKPWVWVVAFCGCGMVLAVTFISYGATIEPMTMMR